MPGLRGVVEAVLYAPKRGRARPTDYSIVTGRGSFQPVEARSLGASAAAIPATTGSSDICMLASALAASPATRTAGSHRQKRVLIEVPCGLGTYVIWRCERHQ
jgi:hypothetical protein